MITKHYVGHDPEKVRAQIEQDCGQNAIILSFHYTKPRGLRRLYFGPQVEVTVCFEESSQTVITEPATNLYTPKT